MHKAKVKKIRKINIVKTFPKLSILAEIAYLRRTFIEKLMESFYNSLCQKKSSLWILGEYFAPIMRCKIISIFILVKTTNVKKFGCTICGKVVISEELSHTYVQLFSMSLIVFYRNYQIPAWKSHSVGELKILPES